jgi:hypothetical protein
MKHKPFGRRSQGQSERLMDDWELVQANQQPNSVLTLKKISIETNHISDSFLAISLFSSDLKPNVSDTIFVAIIR